MGNCSSILDEPLKKVFEWLVQKGGYSVNLEKNLGALEETMEDLKAKRDDLLRRLKREEDKALQRLVQIQVWLTKVEKMEEKVNGIISDRNVELQSFLSTNRYGESVFLTLREVEKLKSEDFKEINVLAPIPEVEERPLQPIIVGQETMLDKAWNHLKEDGVGIMGLHGMGGVGKTTLLTQLNSKFKTDRCGFELVIWVVVSRELQIEKIQDDIAKRVGLGVEDWNQEDKSHKSIHLYNFLMRKRFVLFLDDVWKKVDLDEIGVPYTTRQNGCKVVFTTRSQEVCGDMGVEEPMEVRCLGENDAFDLFQKKVGQITLGKDPGIPDLARIIAKKCCGLPLALNVIGEAMSSKRTIHEWRHAIEVLKSYATEFKGMKDKIFPLLKYSYDNLEQEEFKSCLLYCALYPEDANIDKEELIDYWICDEIIDGSENIEKSEDKGYEIIGSLVRSSLLMQGIDQDGKAFVIMHDIVREMALWIASPQGIQNEAFFVRAGAGLHEIPKVKNLNVVKRMSLMKNKIVHLTGSLVCLELTTFLLQESKLENISGEFFKYMPKLAVLDLSGNRKLSQLPEEISGLLSLQYLNLSETDISHLPIKGLKELKKIIYLNLEKTRRLLSISGISSLHNLKVLKLAYSSFRWESETMEELGNLENIEILTTNIICCRGLEILKADRLLSCTRTLWTYDGDQNWSATLGEIRLPISLREITMDSCFFSKIKMGRKCSFLSLVNVHIQHCKFLRELTFLMFAPNLKDLSVKDSEELEDIINKEKACEVEQSGTVPFPKLVKLHLQCLPELENIYWSPLPFSCLEKIEVYKCLKLKKLPLDSKSGKQGENGLFIRYLDYEWIEGVTWTDNATKTRFLSSCQQIDESNYVQSRN